MAKIIIEKKTFSPIIDTQRRVFFESLKLKERDFKVNGAVPISSENFSSSLGENEKVEFSLYYEIESEQLQFLEYDKYKVALGNIM